MCHPYTFYILAFTSKNSMKKLLSALTILSLFMGGLAEVPEMEGDES